MAEKKSIEKRVLEAQKVVVSNFLFQWKKKFGMDYVLIVRNAPGEVFSRHSVSSDGAMEVLDALTRAETRISGLLKDPPEGGQ